MLSGIIRKAWEKRMDSQSQLNGCVKNFVIDFPEMPHTVSDLVEGGPGLGRGAEKPALISRGKSPMVRIT